MDTTYTTNVISASVIGEVTWSKMI